MSYFQKVTYMKENKIKIYQRTLGWDPKEMFGLLVITFALDY